jgi:hypothetical protein
LNFREELTKWFPTDHASARHVNVIVGTRQEIEDFLIRGTITPAQANQNVELACQRCTTKRGL